MSLGAGGRRGLKRAGVNKAFQYMYNIHKTRCQYRSQESVTNVKILSLFANSLNLENLLLKLTVKCRHKITHQVIAVEHEEMDWIPVNLDSPAGELGWVENKVLGPNLF